MLMDPGAVCESDTYKGQPLPDITTDRKLLITLMQGPHKILEMQVSDDLACTFLFQHP
jgi:hypothetical protein